VFAKVKLIVCCGNRVAGVNKFDKSEDIEGTVSILLVHDVCLDDGTILDEEFDKVFLVCAIGKVTDVDRSRICSGPGIASDSGDGLLLVVGLTTFSWFDTIGELNAVGRLIGEDALERVSAIKIECEANVEADRDVTVLIAEN
jgi:hypothetical protein